MPRKRIEICNVIALLAAGASPREFEEKVSAESVVSFDVLIHPHQAIGMRKHRNIVLHRAWLQQRQVRAPTEPHLISETELQGFRGTQRLLLRGTGKRKEYCVNRRPPRHEWSTVIAASPAARRPSERESRAQ
jgi:hypothetical protein